MMSLLSEGTNVTSELNITSSQAGLTSQSNGTGVWAYNQTKWLNANKRGLIRRGWKLKCKEIFSELVLFVCLYVFFS